MPPRAVHPSGLRRKGREGFSTRPSRPNAEPRSPEVKPPTIPEKAARRIAMTFAGLPRDARRSCLKLAAEHYGVSPATVYRAIAPHRVRPHGPILEEADPLARLVQVADKAAEASRRASEAAAETAATARDADALVAEFRRLALSAGVLME